MKGEEKVEADSVEIYGNAPELGPGHVEVSKLFPAFDKTKSLDENLKALRQYVLESVSPFNRAQFVLLVQLAILVYYPSVALSIVYSEYQEEIMQQQMIQDEEEQIELDQQPQPQSRYMQSTQEMKQMSQNIDQESTKQSPIFQLVQLLQRIVSQFIVKQSQEQDIVNQNIMMQTYQGQWKWQMQGQCIEYIQPQQQQQYNYYCQQQTQQFQQSQMQQQNQRQTQEQAEAQSVRNNENGRVHITVVIRLSGEERQGQQAADGITIIYQNYIIMI